MGWAVFFIFIAVIIVAVAAWEIRISKLKKKNVQNAIKDQGLNITKEIGDLKIDETNKKWMISSGTKVHNFSDISDVEIVQNGEKFKSQNGVFRGVTGGLIFGAAGAVIGASTAKSTQTINNLSVVIYLSDLDCPMEVIKLIATETKTSGTIYNLSYQNAQKISSTLLAMQHMD